jgi:hypothetical protein
VIGSLGCVAAVSLGFFSPGRDEVSCPIQSSVSVVMVSERMIQWMGALVVVYGIVVLVLVVVAVLWRAVERARLKTVARVKEPFRTVRWGYPDCVSPLRGFLFFHFQVRSNRLDPAAWSERRRFDAKDRIGR